MKKIIFILLSVLTLCACEGPMGPQGPQGPQGEGMNWAIEDISVSANQWSLTQYADNNYYVAKYTLPVLTSFIYTDGNVNAYVYLQLEDGREVQHPLPYVYHMEQIQNDGSAYFYTRTISFVYGVGYIQFEVRDSDFEYEVDSTIKPEAMDFRVVMTY